MIRYCKPFKNALTVLSYAEKILHHAHHKRLSKPAWSGKECDLVISIGHKLVDQFCFIDIVIS